MKRLSIIGIIFLMLVGCDDKKSNPSPVSPTPTPSPDKSDSGLPPIVKKTRYVQYNWQLQVDGTDTVISSQSHAICEINSASGIRCESLKEWLEVKDNHGNEYQVKLFIDRNGTSQMELDKNPSGKQDFLDLNESGVWEIVQANSSVDLETYRLTMAAIQTEQARHCVSSKMSKELFQNCPVLDEVIDMVVYGNYVISREFDRYKSLLSIDPNTGELINYQVEEIENYRGAYGINKTNVKLYQSDRRSVKRNTFIHYCKQAYEHIKRRRFPTGQPMPFYDENIDKAASAYLDQEFTEMINSVVSDFEVGVASGHLNSTGLPKVFGTLDEYINYKKYDGGICEQVF